MNKIQREKRALYGHHGEITEEVSVINEEVVKTEEVVKKSNKTKEKEVEVTKNEEPVVDKSKSTTAGPKDTDGDGIPDYLDLDSDNDGIPDSEEK